MSNHNLGHPSRRSISAITAGICSGTVAASMAAAFFMGLGTVASVTSTATPSVAAVSAATSLVTTDTGSGDPWG